MLKSWEDQSVILQVSKIWLLVITKHIGKICYFQ
jgi:hypothetical protein